MTMMLIDHNTSNSRSQALLPDITGCARGPSGPLGCVYGTEAEKQPLKRIPDSNVSSLIPTGLCGRASHHQKLVPTFPGIDSCPMVIKQDFLEIESTLSLNERSQNVVEGGLST